MYGLKKAIEKPVAEKTKKTMNKSQGPNSHFFPRWFRYFFKSLIGSRSKPNLFENFDSTLFFYDFNIEKECHRIFFIDRFHIFAHF